MNHVLFQTERPISEKKKKNRKSPGLMIFMSQQKEADNMLNKYVI